MRIITIALLLAASLWGQPTPDEADTMEFYSITKTDTLSSAAGVFTLQSDAKSKKRVYPQRIVVTGSVDCTITQDKNGTAASSGTLVTPVTLNGDGSPAAKVYTGSNAGAGSTLPPFKLKAGVPFALTLNWTVFARGKDAAQNYNIRTSSITGTVKWDLVWGER